jgi:hypothetical protein
MELQEIILTAVLLYRYSILTFNYLTKQDLLNTRVRIIEDIQLTLVFVPLILFNVFFRGREFYFYSIRVIYIILPFVILVHVIRWFKNKK